MSSSASQVRLVPLVVLEALVTGRENSLFDADLRRYDRDLADAFRGARVALIGAAGSIGFAVLRTLLAYGPKAVSLLDISENNLVEVVRDLRASPDLVPPSELLALPIGLGSLECTRFFHESPPFDYVFNLSAVKHVRSEKDVYTIIRMMDTNCLFVADFLQQLPYRPKKFFSVSSDKAVNPASLMGASKLAMERILHAHSDRRSYSTARFANVAFSDGSLPFGFLKRIEKCQPISAPSDVKRFFISHAEAGQLCVLSAGLGANREVFFPKLQREVNELRFSEIASLLLKRLGFEPVELDSEAEAKRRVAEMVPRGKWPCVFAASDTSGEKQFEEFLDEADPVDFDRFDAVGVITGREPTDEGQRAAERFLAFLRDAKGRTDIGKGEYAAELSRLVPGFSHIETGRNLDQKM